MTLCVISVAGLLGCRAGLAARAKAALTAVGYESSSPARRLSAEDRRRIEAQPRQDLLDRADGRYTLVKDDGVAGYWGLDALQRRRNAVEKPYVEVRHDDHFQAERVIFADLTTGATLVKLTDEPFGTGDELAYFGKSCFNADGSRMIWERSRRPSLFGPRTQQATDTYGTLLVDGDGTRPRLVFGDVPSLQLPICHPTDPDLAYGLSEGSLLELNLRTGKVRRSVATGLPGWWLKLSPDARYACSASYDSGRIVVVSLENGERWEVRPQGRIHDSYRFVPGNTDWIMYWLEGDFRDQGFRMVNFKTGEDIATGVKFDWNHGDVGRTIGFHTSGQLLHYAGGTWTQVADLHWPDRAFSDEAPYYDEPASANGYAQHWPDDQLWAYGTRIVSRPYLSEVSAFFAKPIAAGGRANRFRICTTNLKRSKEEGGGQILDRPNISRDGTKLLFNANVFGAAEVYLVVLRNPRPPVHVEARWSGARVKVSWEAPLYHQEIAGYHIYRSGDSGRGFALLSDALVTGREFVDQSAPAGGPLFYAVRAVEHSGLESGLSAEAGVSSDAASLARAPRRIFVEAEAAIPADLAAPSPDALWMGFEGVASDLHYIWQRRPDRPGRAEVELDVPRAGDYFVSARVKGTAGAAFDIAGQRVACGPSEQWQWVRAPRPARLPAGRQKIGIASDTYGSCLDCFFLSTDGEFPEEGRVLAPRPEALRLTAAAGDRPRLSWSGERSPRWWHYNLYCSDRPGFTPGQRSLLASPDEESYLDWRAPAGPKYYRVTQVTRDGLESAPSNEVRVE
jgi:hypothetical protein